VWPIPGQICQFPDRGPIVSQSWCGIHSSHGPRWMDSAPKGVVQHCVVRPEGGGEGGAFGERDRGAQCYGGRGAGGHIVMEGEGQGGTVLWRERGTAFCLGES
jgi:hypothetical protein